MKKIMFFLTALAALLTGVVPGQAAQIGDPAAPLDIATWVKGGPVDLADVKGKKIVVVEFWATWCGPCKASIPHLTELQKKFADRGVVFVGVSDETAAKVQTFVDQMGDKMDYVVAVDNNGRTSQGYMRAYEQNGIPHAFVVDREGRMAWHGHPMGDLAKVLDKLAATPVAESPVDKQRTEAKRKLTEYTELAARGGDAARLDQLAAQITALDKELGGIDPKQKLDLAQLRRTARFQGLMRDYQRAVAAGKPADEIARIQEQATPLAPPGFKFEDYRGKFALQRAFQNYYRAVTGKGDAEQIADLTRKLELVESDDAEALNEIAWTLLTDENIKTRNPGLALKLAQSAVKASGGRNADVLETHARALFDNGQKAEAIQQQRQAIALTSDQTRKAELQAAFKQYETKAATTP